MNKKRTLVIVLLLTILFPAVVGVNKAQAAYPSFTISEVKKDESVTILTQDMPKNLDWKVLMGEYNTRGENGIEVATFNSGSGGSMLATFNIPDALKGRAMISIRIESLTGGYYYYNWFWNDQANGTWPTPAPTVTPAPTTTPAPTATPAPTSTPAPAVKYPTFNIVAVEKDNTVSVVGKDFPADTEFTVLMGQMWTMGIKRIEAGTYNSGEGGDMTATFTIPPELAGQIRISIRLQATSGGWYAYNWFWNNTTQE